MSAYFLSQVIWMLISTCCVATGEYLYIKKNLITLLLGTVTKRILKSEL